MRYFLFLLLLCGLSLTLTAQKITKSQDIIRALDRAKVDKSAMLKYHEDKLAIVLQRRLPDIRIGNVRLDPNTGEITVDATDGKGKRQNYDRDGLIPLLDDAGNSGGNAAALGWWGCLTNYWIYLNSCQDEQAGVPEYPDIDNAQDEYQRQQANKALSDANWPAPEN